MTTSNRDRDRRLADLAHRQQTALRYGGTDISGIARNAIKAAKQAEQRRHPSQADKATVKRTGSR